ncbi:class I adenylate-forming enzyme family protein [Azospirillum sp.]|uniref:class I adenylate-forming enzyme family protein n=1 Tax=Azospirillum sp. TaxID=34012 RepID=UPI002D4D7D2A|nr:AMP-binding protein [Azospirillum sp.]HYD69153.1 AMP-binding protein [Azospirillum sp.]
MPTFDDINLFLPDVWAGHARRTPNKPAVVCGERRVTWAEFNGTMNRLANALLSSGLRRGDRVAVLVSSSVEAIEAMFGVVKAGACLIPCSSLLTPDQLAVLLNDGGAEFLIVSADLRHLIDPIRDRLPALRADGCIGVGFEGGGWRSYTGFLEGASDAEPDVRFAMGDVFSIMYSSGTTGLPKGVVHTHRARQYFCVSNAVEMRFDSTARALTSTALYTAGTWLMVMPVLFVGGTLHIMPRFTPQDFLNTVARERITHTFIVPSQITMTLAETRLEDHDLSSLRTVLSAGSPLRPDLKAKVLSHLGHAFYELYGFTEGTSTLLRPEEHEAKFLSVGSPLIGQEIAIVDGEGRRLPPGEPGEIAGHGPGLLREYHGKPEETAAAIWRDERGRTFVRSGDIGRLDADGYLTILDRKKDMIITGGLNIFPADIEKVVSEHPDVLDITVVGVAHEKWGETPVGVAVLRDGATATADELLAWANARLAKHQRLTRLDIRAELPRNALGKVLKRELRKEFSEQGA